MNKEKKQEKQEEKSSPQEIELFLQEHQRDVIELLNQNPNKWTKVAKQLKIKFKSKLNIQDWHITDFYSKIPIEDRQKILDTKKKIPDQVIMLTQLLTKSLNIFDKIPDDKVDYTSLVKTIMDVREKIAKVTGEGAWNEKLDSVLLDASRVYYKIIQSLVLNKKVMNNVMDTWDKEIKAVKERNKL
jgi:hypothetical protein